VSEEFVDRLLGVGIFVVIFIVLFSAVGGIVATDVHVDGSLNIVDGQERFAYEPVNNLTTEQTLGTQLNFDGTGAIEGQTDDLGGNWSVCTWARPDDTDANMTVISVQGEQTIQYLGNQTTPQWVGRYWDAGERETYDVAVDATATGTRTHVCFQQTTNDITLYANASASPTVTTTGSHTLTDAQYNISAFNGSVEETRIYNASLDSADRTTLRDHPSRPLGTPTPVARIMYDVRSGPVTSIPMYFTGTSATVTNADIEPGVGGDDLTEGTDYRVDNLQLGNPKLIALDGGDLDGAPVVFISYDSQTSMLEGAFMNAWQLLKYVVIFFVLGILASAGYFAHNMLDGGNLR